MIFRTAALALSIGMSSIALAQATPAVTATTPVYNPGIVLPMIDGNFQYSLSASELIQSGYYDGVGTTTSFSGNVQYSSKTQKAPFSILFSGGYMLSNNYGSTSSTYENLNVTQGLILGRWSMSVADSLTFLPDAPSSGLAGVPGVGDVGIPIQQGSGVPAQSILTNYDHRFSNTIMGSVSRQLSGRTSLSASASNGKLIFIGDYGLDSNQFGATLGLNHQIDRRNTVGVSASYSDFSYGNNVNSTFQSVGVSANYSHVWSRQLTTSVNAGPQWIDSFTGQVFNNGGTSPPVAVPSRLTYSLGANVSYTRRFGTLVANYSHSANGGSGIETGAIGDTVTVATSRNLGRDWSSGGSLSYSRTSGLVTNGVTNSLYAGFQANRRLTQHLSLFVSYTVQHQGLDPVLAGTGAFSGLSNTGSIGITFSPRSVRLGQF